MLPNAYNDTKTGIVAESRKNMQQAMAMQVFLVKLSQIKS